MKNVVMGFLALGLVLAGCGGDKAAESPSEEKKETAEQAAPAEAKKEDAGGTVEGQLAAWCAAQTKGDFDAYSAFYAEGFEGIKRTKRGKAKTYDLKAWLKDRGGMFKMPLQVDCQALQVAPEKDGVTSVTFEQYWQSPSYADEGPKRVDFKNVGGKMMIVGEEMIKSTKWDRKKFKDGSAPPKRAFKTYAEIGDHPMENMVSKKGHKEYRKCHFVKPKDWGEADEDEWPADCAVYTTGRYGMYE